MSMTSAPDVLKSEILAERLAQLEAFLNTSFHENKPVHEVEHGIWSQLLQLGHQCLEQLFSMHGSGDMGATVTLPDGEECRRLPELHPRRYVSIFGEFHLQRTVYGSREGQKQEFVPLDNRLLLPASSFSYVLQDWDQALCVEQAFGQAQSTVARMLELKQSVASLEHMNQEMAACDATVMEGGPCLPPGEEYGGLHSLPIEKGAAKLIVNYRFPRSLADRSRRPSDFRSLEDFGSLKTCRCLGRLLLGGLRPHEKCFTRGMESGASLNTLRIQVALEAIRSFDLTAQLMQQLNQHFLFYFNRTPIQCTDNHPQQNSPLREKRRFLR